MTGRRLIPLQVLLIAGAALFGAAPALASQAVSIDVGRIDVSDALAPGGQYKLPAFGVRNPGTEATTYRITVSYVDGQAAARPAQAWFSFTPAELTLAPGEARPVSAVITLPTDAEPGDYAALVGPEIVASGTGAQVGAGAAAHLTFTVSPSSGFDAFLRWLGRTVGQNPWILVVVGLLLLAVAAWFLRRRFNFSVSRRA
jgi:LPXTG-motif cell wall-anchored protein